MKCQHCGAECSDQAKFCEQCGEKLNVVCPKCGTECSETAKFCEKCGAALTPSAETEPQPKDEEWIDNGKAMVSTLGVAEGKTRRYKKGKGKPMPKKTILILVIIFLVGAVGIISPYLLGKQDQNADTEKTEEEIYTTVLNEYSKAKKDPVFNADKYKTLAASILDFYHQYGGFELYYATADLDGNGTKELIIAMKPNDQDGYTLVDLYTLDDTKTPHKAIDNSTFGDRSTLRILGDGTIIEEASGGADDTTLNYYRISADGYTLEKTQGSKVADKQDFQWEKIK